jgi:non-ribosomal peptide synthetase component E (peptide arylation enzyme)
MILGDTLQTATTDSVRASTLDDLFRRAAVRRPDAVALIDPPNRARFTDGPVRQITYSEADRMIWGIAGRLRQLGLTTDSVVATQLPNTIESVLTLLGIVRAGMIAAPLPMLWREREACAALTRIGAKALLSCARIGATDHGHLALRIAAQVFAIRHVCGFGPLLPDGMVSLDDLYTAAPEAFPVIERAASPAAHLATVTFDVDAAGMVAVARNHAQLVSGGLTAFLEARIAENATILSGLPLSSFAGLSLTLLPWLMSGGTLALHQPFDPDIFDEQRALYGCEVAVVPATLLGALADSGQLDKVAQVIALWRAPERLASAAKWSGSARLTDVQAFGEVGLMAARRDAETGMPVAIPTGLIHTPRGAPAWLRVAEVARSANGTLKLRGPMVQAHPFPPVADDETAATDGFVDTGYACRAEDGNTLVITGAPTGLAMVGGYRLAQGDIETLVKGIDPGAVVAAVPDALSGHRLGGTAADRTALQERLTALGANPLVAGAFRIRNAA